MDSTKGYTPPIEDNMIKCLLSLPKKQQFYDLTSNKSGKFFNSFVGNSFIIQKSPFASPNNASKKKFKSPKKQDSKDHLSLA